MQDIFPHNLLSISLSVLRRSSHPALSWLPVASMNLPSPCPELVLLLLHFLYPSSLLGSAL